KKVLCLVGFLMAGQAHAISYSYTGNFEGDDSRFYTTFGVTTASTVNLTSWGYAGGTNAAGDTIVDGGFDTQLFVFDSSGSLVASNDDGSSVVSASSGLSWDALLSLSLGIDTYTVVLTQFNNDFISGDPVTGSWSGAGVSNFVDVSGSQRTSAYAFDISGDYITDVTGFQVDVPEPATLTLMGLGLAGIGFARKKKQA
ncbi:MAG: DVUA0089 family protein, partial [Sedimenticola sp.]